MLVVIRGAGDIATGIALRLWRAGMQVVMTDIPAPTAIRRTVCFSQAVVHGEAEVEGVQAVSAGSHSVKGLFRTVSQYRPITVEMTEDVAEITVNILVKYGCKIPPLAERVQENVKNAVQNMTQITVSRVNVVVAGLAPEQPEPEPAQEA